MNRELIFSTLFALTDEASWIEDGSLVGFASRSRRIKLFSDVTAAQQPWIGQSEHGESSAKGTRLPYKWTLEANWLVYHVAGAQPGSVPTTTNNLILDALEKVMQPKPSDIGFFDKRNTLSGLVHHCYIDGELFKDPGDIDKQALMLIPIKILVP